MDAQELSDNRAAELRGQLSWAPNFKTIIANPVIFEVKELSLGEEEWEDVCVKGTPVLSLYLASSHHRFGPYRAKHVGGTPVL